jgi:hypothetical protein
MSLSDLVRTVRGACQCSQAADDRTYRSITMSPREVIAVTSPPPGGVSRTIDVSHLPPPLPMVRILEALRDLGPQETLLVRHTRRPIHLYPKLDALGCTHETTEPEPGRFEIRISSPAARSS